MVQQMVTPTNNDYCPDRIYIALSRWHFEDFRNIFLPNINEDQIEILPPEYRAPGSVPYGKSGPGNCIACTKKLNESLR